MIFCLRSDFAAAGVALSCWIGAAVLWNSLQGMPFPDLGAPMTANHPEIEQARELIGLLIVGFWSAFVLWRVRRSAELGG